MVYSCFKLVLCFPIPESLSYLHNSSRVKRQNNLESHFARSSRQDILYQIHSFPEGLKTLVFALIIPHYFLVNKHNLNQSTKLRMCALILAFRCHTCSVENYELTDSSTEIIHQFLLHEAPFLIGQDSFRVIDICYAKFSPCFLVFIGIA